MTDVARARASEMLAALSGDRFLLFPESELIALGIPYELRRKTQNEALRARKARPFDPKLMPTMTPAAWDYLYQLEVARRESTHSNNFRVKHATAVRRTIERHHALGPYDKPISGMGLVQRWQWHGQQIENWHMTIKRHWDGMNEVERLWFGHKPEVTRWAHDFPVEAPAPHRFYPTEETPERERQMRLLRWVLGDSSAG